jgi:hypothetical protein
MMWPGLLTFAIACVFAIIGGWAGWIFAVIFGALAVDILLDSWRVHRMRGRSR